MEQDNKAQATSAKSARFRYKPFRRVGMIALAVVIACSAWLCAVSLRNESLRRTVNYTYSGVLQQKSLYAMSIDKKQQQEKVRETVRHGQTGKFRYFSETYLHFDYAMAYGSIIFGNVESNDCVLVFSIFDGAGTLLYRSDGVEPGKYVSQIRLWHTFAPGEHACRMYVSAYNPETYAAIGTQYSDITVFIGG